MDVVRAIRNLRTERKVPAGARLPAQVLGGRVQPVLEAMRPGLVALARLEDARLEFASPGGPRAGVALTVGPVEVHVMLDAAVDTGQERARVERELAEIQVQIDRLEKLLASDFAARAPAHVVGKEREKLAGYRETQAKLRRQLSE